MDQTTYDEIRPYNDNEVPAAIRRMAPRLPPFPAFIICFII